MEKRLVSVMMPAYNAETYVKEAIESLLSQRYLNWELVVVDDGSTDRTPDIVTRYADQDPRISVFHQENGGEAAARNAALTKLRGDFVAFLDADDLFLPQHLSEVMSCFQAHPEHDGIYTDGFYIDEAGNRIEKLSSYRRGPFEGDIFEQIVRASDALGPPLCMVLRRKRITDLQLSYDVDVGLGTDWDFITQFADQASFGYVNEVSCLYRIHQENISITTETRDRLRGRRRCREKAIKLSGFDRCSLEVRWYAFYDLLVNLLTGSPQRQAAICQWREFRSLPHPKQAQLLRLMAGRAILEGDDSRYVKGWLQKAWSLHPTDLRNGILYHTYKISPSLCHTILRLRTRVQTKPRVQTLFGESYSV